MTTTIDNNQRKFLVQSQGFGGWKDIFCNLEAIPDVLREAFEPNDEYKVFEYFNRKLKRCSKKHLNEMFAANKMKLTYKQTHLVFPTMKDKKTAVEFLLKMGIKFSGVLKKPILTVAPSSYIKHYLDLYLPEHLAGSTFNYKQ